MDPGQQQQYAAPPADGQPPNGSHKRVGEDLPGTPETKRQAHGAPVSPVSETVYRLLAPGRKVGAIIGKGGTIVKTIRDETGGRIRVVDGVPGCDERVIVISSPSLAGGDWNAAQNALFSVHKRLMEHEEAEAQKLAPGTVTPHVTRLLVCHTQAGCIIGKAGKIIKDIREASGAHIKILPPEELPACALSNDRVVQLSGNGDQLSHALRLVARQIRDNPPKERPGGAPPCLPHLASGGYRAVSAGGPSGGWGGRPY
eukprot:jgi/Botrbrau1/887/Bobra.0167s0011.2